jgi:cytosine/adenosine deaminase-related metal-dependent hydrolase
LFTPEDLYLSQLLGYYEALNAGVTTVVDYASHTWSSEHAKTGLKGMVDSGVRGVFAYQLSQYGNFTWNDTLSTFESMAADKGAVGSRVDMGLAYDSFSRTGEVAEQRTREVIALAK